MARRPPTRDFPGVSRRGMSVIAELERTRFWPGAVAQALGDWALVARDPIREHCTAESVCGSLRCCPDLDQARAIFHAVAAALPAKDAAPFRRRLAEFD